MTTPVPQTFSNTIIGGPNTSIAVPVPSGVATDNIIIVCLYVETTATITPPSGFTQKSSASTTASGEAHTARIFWKRATGADSGTYTFSWTGNAYNASASMRVSGCVASGDPFGTPINTAVNNSGSGTTTPAVATLTPSTNDCLIVFFGTSYAGSATNWVPPSGFTERVDNGYPPYLCTLAQTTATATGSVSASGAASAVGRTGTVGYLLPVVTSQAAAGTVAGVSAVIGDAHLVAGVAGTAAGTSAVIGDAAIIPAIPPAAAAGVVAAVSGVTGDASRVLGVSGTVAGVSGTDGTLGASLRAVSGTVAGISGAAGTTLGRLGVSGTAAAVSALLGTPGAIYAGVAGTVIGVSAVHGSTLVTGKPGQGAEVLVLFDPNEVLTGGRVTFYTFDLLDSDENLVGQLRGVSGGEITIDAYAAVKATGKLEVRFDPSNAHLPDGQPDFLGVQINTPLGPQAASTSAVTSPPFDHMIVVDTDGADISFGDRVILTTSAGVAKESTAFTVTQKVSGGGFTTISFTPDAAGAIAVGDLMKTVEVSFRQVVDWLNARIRPMIRIARLGGGDDPEGRLVPAGVFLCAAPVEQWEATGLVRPVEIADKLSILDQDIASGDPTAIAAYVAPAGSNIITLVQALIAETGELYPAIQPDSKVLAAPLVWDVGTTRLKIINDLLDAAGYFSLFCDGYGQYQAVPYVQPSDRVPVYDSIAPFSDGPQSLMDPAWTRDRDIYSIPNRYLVVGQGDAATAALTSLATNIDPASPYSFPSRGRWITAVETGVEAVDQAALDTIARARLSSASSVTNQITLKHVFLPDLHVNSVVHFINPDSGLDTNCYVVHTSIPFDPTALCTTTMRVVG